MTEYTVTITPRGRFKWDWVVRWERLRYHGSASTEHGAERAARSYVAERQRLSAAHDAARTFTIGGEQ